MITNACKHTDNRQFSRRFYHRKTCQVYNIIYLYTVSRMTGNDFIIFRVFRGSTADLFHWVWVSTRRWPLTIKMISNKNGLKQTNKNAHTKNLQILSSHLIVVLFWWFLFPVVSTSIWVFLFRGITPTDRFLSSGRRNLYLK